MIDKLAVYVIANNKSTKEHFERCLWSIDNQPEKIDYDVIVNCNIKDQEFFDTVVSEVVSEDFQIIQNKDKDESLGHGINSCFDHYLKNYKKSKWSHMCFINVKDYFYPMAFDFMNEIHKKSNFDYLSGIPHQIDCLRSFPPHRDDPRKIYPYQPDRWLWSFVEHRLPVYPYIFWNAEQIPGIDQMMCASTKAVETGIRAFPGNHDATSYFLTLNALLQHVNENLNFVSTDCNEIYISDFTEEPTPSKKTIEKYDPDRGWPFDKEGVVYSELNQEKYKVLSALTRQFFPYVTMPQLWNNLDKCQFISGNEI